MSVGPLAEYPDSFGGHRGSVFAHTGPASYVAVDPAPIVAATGDVVDAVEAGLKYFDFVVGGLSDSGTYTVLVGYPAGNPSTNKQAAHATQCVLMWLTAANCVEVTPATNLSGETVRLFALGRY